MSRPARLDFPARLPMQVKAKKSRANISGGAELQSRFGQEGGDQHHGHDARRSRR